MRDTSNSTPPAAFKRRLSSITMPDATRAAILAEIAREREAPATPRDLAVIGDGRRPLVTRRRALAVAACTGLIVLGGAALGAYLAGRPSAAQLKAVADNGGFVLKAYADGAPATNGAAVLASGRFITNLSSSWSEGDADAQGRMTYRIAWGIDLSYLGDQVERVEFSLPENDAIKLSWSTPSNASSPAQGEGSAIAIDRGERGALSTNYGLVFRFIADDGIQRLRDAYRAAQARDGAAEQDDAALEEALDSYRYATLQKAARLLSETPLTATATLSTGQTVTHAYRISPVGDFERLGIGNDHAFWAAVDEGKTQAELEALKAGQPALFTIEQLS